MPEVAPVPLSQLTTLRTGGEPARLIDASTLDEAVAALREVWAEGEPWFVLGGGSNLFVGDEPFEGTVVRLRTSGIEELPGSRDGTVRLRVQAGHDWDALVAETVARGALDQAHARPDQPRRSNGGRDRRARSFRAEPGGLGVRPRAAARTGPGQYRAVGRRPASREGSFCVACACARRQFLTPHARAGGASCVRGRFVSPGRLRGDTS